MKEIKIIIGYIATLLWILLFTGCNSPQDEIVYPGEPMEVLFSATGSEFVQTRALIGENEPGTKFGTFYILQTTHQEAEKETFWGHYQIESGYAGKLSPIDDNDNTYTLFWADEDTQYFFQGLSVPEPEGDAAPGVTFDHDENGNQTGTVRFGDYRTGLEYFVAVTLGPRSMSAGHSLTMTFKRQVCKVVFMTISHQDQNGGKLTDPEACRIIFPNLPAKATFDMEHFKAQQNVYNGELKQGYDYVTLEFDKEDMGVEMEWEKRNNNQHEFYLPPFKFWNGEDNIPENQPGFYIVEYEDKTYTGNIYGDNNCTELFAGDYARLFVTLKDGPLSGGGGGGGSAITKWEVGSMTESPHHPLPGIYSKEEAEKLLDALLNDKEIPATFYQGPDETTGGKKIIRLLTNIDWSSATKDVHIPEGVVLMGQGFNIELGTNVSISGEMKGKLYVNGKLYMDGQPVPEE